MVSAVCHGPAGLVSARGADGKSILSGRRCTGFTNTEEVAVNKQDVSGACGFANLSLRCSGRGIL